MFLNLILNPRVYLISLGFLKINKSTTQRQPLFTPFKKNNVEKREERKKKKKSVKTDSGFTI